MAWSGGTYTKGNNGTGGWVGDASLGIGIEAGRHDTQDNDFATGINQCLNKDGSNSCTGDLNLGGFKPVNLAAGTAAAPAICAGGDVNTGIFSPAADQIGIATNGTERVRIDSTGNIGVNTTNPAFAVDIYGAYTSALLRGFTADGGAPNFVFNKSRSATVGTNTLVLNNDGLGTIAWQGANGTDYTTAASIVASVDGTPGASNDMPGRLIFSTTADGSGSPTERMRIDSTGCVGIGTASSTDTRLLINGTNTTNTTYAITARNSANTNLFFLRNDGGFFTGLTTASPYNNTSGAAPNVWVDAFGYLGRQSSSLRYKKDVVNYSKGLSAVNLLRPVFYKDKKDDTKQYAGLIAEEVHEAGLHEFVFYNDENQPDALHYSNMVALAFKAIQELNAKVEALEARVAELEAA